MLKVLVVDDESVVRRGIVLGVDWASMGWHLLWVTLGHLLGGAVLLGLPLWYAAEPEKTQSYS